jgi:drug/metabolite transporter (DMT)-like permease
VRGGWRMLCRMSGAGRGIAWAFAAAVLSAHFVLPWKVAAQSGEISAVVLVLLVSAALFSTAALPWVPRATAPAGRRALGRADVALAAALAVLTLIGNWASAAAVAELSPPVLSVLLRSEVLVVALLALVLLGERVERRFWLGAAIAGLGLVVIQPPGSADVEKLSGLLYGLAAAASFGTMTVLTRRAIREIDPVRVNMARLWLSVALWFAVYGAPPPAASFDRSLVVFAALAALCGPVASRLCLMYSTRHVDARITAMIGLSAPALTVIVTWLVLGDWPSRSELAGGALMTLGIAIPMTHWVRTPDAAAAPESAPI